MLTPLDAEKCCQRNLRSKCCLVLGGLIRRSTRSKTLLEIFVLASTCLLSSPSVCRASLILSLELAVNTGWDQSYVFILSFNIFWHHWLVVTFSSLPFHCLLLSSLHTACCEAADQAPLHHTFRRQSSTKQHFSAS